MDDLKERLEMVHSLVDKWRKILKIDDKWAILCCIDDEGEDYATIWYDEYWKATITFESKAFHDDCKELERTVAHELMHIVLYPLSDSMEIVHGKRNRAMLKRREEAVISHLEKVLFEPSDAACSLLRKS
jgi:hypothetical protein